MRAKIKSRRIRQNSERTRIANRDYVKEAIIKFRIGSYLHAAAVVSRIGDAELGDAQPALGMFVKLNVNFDRRRAKRRLHGGRGI